MGDNVTVEPFHPGHNGRLLPELVECYREVFAWRPWREWKKCPNDCGQWGKEKEDTELLQGNDFLCLDCGSRLVDFWPTDVVEQAIKEDIDDTASCWLALDTGRVIGFCWGFPRTLEKLDRKLEAPVSEAIRKRFGIVSEPVAYQSELGLLPEFRGKHHSRKMVEPRFADFLRQGLKIGVVRVRETPEPSVTYSWFTTKLGYEVVFRYPPRNGRHDGRVIIAQRIDEANRLLLQAPLSVAS